MPWLQPFVLGKVDAPLNGEHAVFHTLTPTFSLATPGISSDDHHQAATIVWD
jgi:hypothetical protein